MTRDSVDGWEDRSRSKPGNRRQGCYRMDQRTGSGRVGSPVGKSAGSITERASQSAEKEVISKLYKKRPRQRPRNRISILWWTTLGKRNAVRVAIKQPVQRAVFDVETSDGVPECRSPCVCHNESLVGPSLPSFIQVVDLETKSNISK